MYLSLEREEVQDTNDGQVKAPTVESRVQETFPSQLQKQRYSEFLLVSHKI